MKQPSFWSQVLQYLYLKKRDPDAPINTSIKFMHGMNRISILLFLAALIILILRLVVFKRG
jgi:hypothetical protein